MHVAPPRLLIADDDHALRATLVRTLGRAGYDCVEAADGEEAWEAIRASPSGFDAFLLDRAMPRMDGIELLGRIKKISELLGVPAILLTGACEVEDVSSGLRAGAYYYLTKPCEPDVLLAVVASAVDARRRYNAMREEIASHRGGSALLTSGGFELRTLPEARHVAILLAGAFPEPERAVVGLMELMVNAVEHGNLGITYTEKSALLARSELAQEIARRLEQPLLAARLVRVAFRRDAGGITTFIEDEGGGFDWRAYLDYDPARAFDPNGRGIAIAREMSFDGLTYNEHGNAVTATVRLGPRREEAPSVPPPGKPG
jgi:sigma-B regulation protein RsbU (phosphoserine phosphatase)